jgi:hypothetical protein
MAEERVEQQLNDDFYELQHPLHRVQRAVADARDLAYLVLDRVPDTPEFELVRYYANHWLDTNGRNALRESGVKR